MEFRNVKCEILKICYFSKLLNFRNLIISDIIKLFLEYFGIFLEFSQLQIFEIRIFRNFLN